MIGLGILLALWVFPQGLFAFDVQPEVESWFSLYDGLDPNRGVNTRDSNLNSEVYLKSLYMGGVSDLYQKSKSYLGYRRPGFELRLGDVHLNQDIVQGNNHYAGSYQHQSLDVRFQYLDSPDLSLGWGVALGSKLGYQLLIGRPLWGLSWKTAWSRQEDRSQLSTDVGEFGLRWDQEQWSHHLIQVYRVGSYHHRFELGGSWSTPLLHSDSIISRFESSAWEGSLYFQWTSWSYQLEVLRRSSAVSLRGVEKRSAFVQANWDLNVIKNTWAWQSEDGHHLGFRSLYFDLEVPLGAHEWTINPEHFPKEGVENFWFIKSNDFLRWGMRMRAFYLGLQYEKDYEWENFSLGHNQALGRIYYQVEELKELHTRWLGFLPIASEKRSFDTRMNTLDIWIPQIRFQYGLKSWKLEASVAQAIPLWLDEADSKFTFVKNNIEVKEEPQDPENPEEPQSGEDSPSERELAESAARESYSLGSGGGYRWGEGMKFELNLLVGF